MLANTIPSVHNPSQLSVLILFFIYLGALRFQEFSTDLASTFVCIGSINILTSRLSS
jgi:hypothetical protein